jgi:hypothetical protein
MRWGTPRADDVTADDGVILQVNTDPESPGWEGGREGGGWNSSHLQGFYVWCRWMSQSVERDLTEDKNLNPWITDSPYSNTLYYYSLYSGLCFTVLKKRNRITEHCSSKCVNTKVYRTCLASHIVPVSSCFIQGTWNDRLSGHLASFMA